MPNTGRFYAPAAAAYRERYMRPYSTLSPPVGSHAMSPVAYGRTGLGMVQRPEAEAETYSPTAYDSRIRGREVEGAWSTAFVEKQQSMRPRTWSEEDEQEVAVRRGAPLLTSTSLRPHEVSHQSEASHVAALTRNHVSRDRPEPTPLPSTLPRLSSLLRRSPPDAVNFEGQARFAPRKRARETSPAGLEAEPPVRMSRRFYEDEAHAERLAHDKYVSSQRGDEHRSSATQMHTADRPLSAKDPMALANARSHHRIAFHQSALPSSTHDHDGPQHYFTRDEDLMDDQYTDYSTRSSGSYRDQAVLKQVYESHGRALQEKPPNHYSPDTQLTLPLPVALSSPPLTSLPQQGDLSPRRYAEGKEGDSVIEAAADLVEERSPSKRESITKLLLKSKEFLKAKSLMRNRNNEIDWVATFLNVGFESSSIYSLMCPLRKGRWKVEEEKYTMGLLRLIECGGIRLRHGQSIRGFIAKKLHSDDMRVLKKLSNCKVFHFARMINPRMSEDEEIDDSSPNMRARLEKLEKLKAEFLRSVQLEALVAVRKYLSDTSIRDLLNARD